MSGLIAPPFCLCPGTAQRLNRGIAEPANVAYGLAWHRRARRRVTSQRASSKCLPGRMAVSGRCAEIRHRRVDGRHARRHNLEDHADVALLVEWVFVDPQIEPRQLIDVVDSPFLGYTASCPPPFPPSTSTLSTHPPPLPPR